MADLVSMGILIDIVDEEWMRETLPDDDVPFPAGVTAPAIDEAEEMNNVEPPLISQDKWNELGLHTLL